MKRVVVIGGGPAGGICAANASANDNEVILIEKNDKLFKKLLITGKGRCNITNNSDISDFFDQIPTNREFLYSSFYSFSNTDIVELINKEGVETKVERGNRVFPVSDKSLDVANALSRHLKKSGVTIALNEKVVSIEKKDKFVVQTNCNKYDNVDSVVIATGGISYPATGSTGDGYAFAKKMGHRVVKPKAGLVPLEIKESFCKELTGLSLKNVSLKLISNDKILYEDFGEMMFTPYGVTGPIIISSSCHILEKNENIIYIDLKPALTEKQLDDRLLRDLKEFANKDFLNSLNKLLPKRLISVIIELSGIDPKLKCNSVTKEQRRKLGFVLKNLKLTVNKKRPVEEAVITVGGIDVSQINPATMESKLIKGLFFCGEVIDVDGYTGGYNLQIAYSTGYLAGVNCIKTKKTNKD